MKVTNFLPNCKWKGEEKSNIIVIIFNNEKKDRVYLQRETNERLALVHDDDLLMMNEMN
jgi:hypothetical protein